MAARHVPTSLRLAQQLRLNVDRLRRTVRNRRTLDDIPRRHEAVLSWLGRKGPLTTADLARWEQIPPQSMGSTVAELLAAGLVGKSADPTDRRRSPAFPGERAGPTIWPVPLGWPTSAGVARFHGRGPRVRGSARFPSSGITTGGDGGTGR
jgi:hypothetical protein